LQNELCIDLVEDIHFGSHNRLSILGIFYFDVYIVEELVFIRTCFYQLLAQFVFGRSEEGDRLALQELQFEDELLDGIGVGEAFVDKGECLGAD